jgi:hypothetical protein
MIWVVGKRSGLLERIWSFLVVEREPRPYFRVRFRWWRPFDVRKFAEEMKGAYEVEVRDEIDMGDRIDLFRDFRVEMRVRADTLQAFITPYKAIMFQDEVAPLSQMDYELERLVLKRYPYVRDTPFV